jgi:hypothetical protein
VNVELDTGDMVLNIGPQHPATHGTLRIVVRLDGERVVSADPIIGYMHRGYEKLTEYRTYPQITTLINRIDWLSSFANEVPFISGAEMLMGIEAPPRAQYIRTVLTELSRIATFLLFLGEMGLQVGAITPAFYGFRDREYVLTSSKRPPEVLPQTSAASAASRKTTVGVDLRLRSDAKVLNPATCSRISWSARLPAAHARSASSPAARRRTA